MNNQSSLSVLTCSIDMHFPPAEVDCGLQLLLSSVSCIESKPGCLSCSVARDVANDGTRILYKETWASEESFTRHTRSEEFRRVLISMELCSEEPEVVIGNFSGHSGLTYLQHLCEQQEVG